MKEDVLRKVIETLMDGIESALKQNKDYDKWASISQTISATIGLCQGTILMDKKEK